MRRIVKGCLAVVASFVLYVAYFGLTLFPIGEGWEGSKYLEWPMFFPARIHSSLPGSLHDYTSWMDTYAVVISILVYSVPLYFLFELIYRRIFRAR